MTRSLIVAERTDVAAGVVQLDLRDPSGFDLPEWAPGAHVDLHLPGGHVRQYSLCGDPGDRKRWQVAVLREPEGRGGSACVHDKVAVGDELPVTGPRNHFPLVSSPRYQFIAGGIGITPIIAMIEAAEAGGADWKLLYGGRSEASMAFLDRLDGDDRGTIWPQDEKGLLDLDAVLGVPQPDTLVYCCGPGALLDAVEEGCAGWPDGSLHLERFAAKVVEVSPDALSSFEVECARSGVTVTVPEGTSIFDAVEKAGVEVLGSCMEGICGTCECDVLEGTPDHRDLVLTPQEHARNDQMLACCSGSKSAVLVLDL